MKNYNIALIEGDGIGPEIIREGAKILKAVSEVCGFSIECSKLPYGADHYLKTGEVLPDRAIREIKDYDAIYFGACGDPRVEPSVLEVGLILKLRMELDQYVNLRPIKLYPNVESPLKNLDNLDFYMVRENTEDFYNGLGDIIRNSKDSKNECTLSLKRDLYEAQFNIQSSISNFDDYAFNVGMISRKGAERVIRYAFELARNKGKNKVTSVDKANILPQMYGLWREAFDKVSKEYPDIQTEYGFVDATAMWLIKNPQDYGVLVSPNLFGDILTDLGAAISGGLGFAAGANINPRGISMFEPIHGSAPKHAGKNTINPIATILAGGMLLENIGEKAAGSIVENAVIQTLKDGLVKTRDFGGNSKTSQLGDEIVRNIYKISKK